MVLVICRCCCCGSMETLSGLHHSKSNCNLVVKDHFDSLSDLFYSFVIDEEAASLGLLCCTQVLLTPILCLVSKLRFIPPLPFEYLLLSPVLQWSASTPTFSLLEGIHLQRRQKLLLDCLEDLSLKLLIIVLMLMIGLRFSLCWWILNTKLRCSICTKWKSWV